MKSILLLCEAYGGGVKTYIDVIYKHQQLLDDVQLHVLVSSKRLEPDIKINRQYIINDNLSFGKSIFKLVKALLAIHQVVKQQKITLVHANSTFSGVLMYLYKTFVNRKLSVIYTPHGYYSFKRMPPMKKRVIQWIERQINNKCELVIHVSHSEETEAVNQHVVMKQKSVVIFNGVTEPTPWQKSENDRLMVINLARVDDQKNPFQFLTLAKYLLEKGLPLQFIWAGNGKYLEHAKDYVKSQQLEEHIQFIGYVDDKNRLLSQADVYLSTSHYEGLPFSVIEAMSYKIPLLLSNNVGHADLVEDGKNGWLFDVEDAEALHKAIIQLQRDRHYFSRHSYERFKQYFSLESMLGNLKNVYGKL